MDSEVQNRIANHSRIYQLLDRGNKRLHQIFLERWKIYHKLNHKVFEWKNNEKCGKIIAKLCIEAEITSVEQKLLKRGKVEEWDITLAKKAIEAVSNGIRNYGGKIDAVEDKEIKKMKRIRNEISHGKPELADDQFFNYWNNLLDILIKLGDNQSDIEELKEKLMKIGNSNVDDVKSKFKLLKENAGNFFKKKEYLEAIEIYSQILEQLSGILPEDQAEIFSERSEAYLMLKDENSLKMAKRDAEFAIKLWPSWWKGYYCLAKVESNLGEWYDAAKSLENAISLNSESKEVRDEFSYVRKQIGIISREEHFNPAFQPKPHKEEIKQIWSNLGVSNKMSIYLFILFYLLLLI